MNFLNDITKSLKPYKYGEQPQTDEWIKLNTNEFPYPPSKKVRKALGRIQKEYSVLRRYPHPLAEPLRSKIAQELNLLPEEVVITNGSDEALSLISRVTLNPLDRAITPEITYSLYDTILGSVNAAVVRKSMRTRNKLPFQIDLKAIAATKGKTIFLANPNAVTGEYIPPGRLLEHIRKSSKLWVIDEAYMDFCSTPSPSLLHHLEGEQNIIIVRTFSKGYGLAGLRVGYALSKNKEIMEGLYKMKDSYNQDKIAISLALEALRDPAYYNKKWKEVIGEREKLITDLRLRDFEVLPSQANFILAKHISMDSKNLYLRLRENHILTRHFAHSGLSEYIRISIGLPEENRILLDRMDIVNEV